MSRKMVTIDGNQACTPDPGRAEGALKNLTVRGIGYYLMRPY